MKHLAAFALLVLGGKENPTAEDVEKYLRDVGVKADSDKIKIMIDNVQGKNFHELVQGGLLKMASMGTGSAPAAGASKASAAAPAKEEKKEEAEEVDMGNLFGGDDDGY